MKVHEYIRLLHSAEDIFPVYEWKWLNIDVWPLLKVGLAFHLDDHAKTYNSASLLHHGTQMLKDRLSSFFAKLKDAEHEDTFETKAEVVFLSLTVERGFKVRNHWYNLYCDPLIEKYNSEGYSTLLLESALKGRYRYPRYSPSVYVQPQLNILAAKSVLRDSSPDYFKWPEFRSFAQFMEQEAQVTEAEIRSILKRLNLVRRWADFFKQVFSKVTPKLGIVVSYYGPLGMSFVQACHESGIPCVDLQHGVQGNNHIAYGRWHNIPQKGYSLLPSIFWCWDDTSKSNIDNWSYFAGKNHRSVLGGNPLMSEFANRNSSLTKYFDPLVDEVFKSYQNNILITLQPGEISQILIDIIKVSPSDWHWWIRLHPTSQNPPSELIECLERHAPGRFDWQNASRLPLYAILKKINVHVTNFSSTVLEAEKFGIQTVLLHKTGEEYYPNQIKAGTASLALTSEHGMSLISDFLRQTIGNMNVPDPFNATDLFLESWTAE